MRVSSTPISVARGCADTTSRQAANIRSGGTGYAGGAAVAGAVQAPAGQISQSFGQPVRASVVGSGRSAGGIEPGARAPHAASSTKPTRAGQLRFGPRALEPVTLASWRLTLACHDGHAPRPSRR